MVRPLMVSACLAGVCCVYDGTHNLRPTVERLCKEGKIFLFCPEILGGLKVPHPPSEMRGGDGFDVLKGSAVVVSRDGEDVTKFFIRGARRSLEFAWRHGVKKAVLKAKSPSCGCGEVFDGTFSKTLIAGFGVTAALLKQNGIEVINDVDFLKNKSEVRSRKSDV
ncbi:MAG: DUF523 domain-containing protein [Candidatus Omnitrophota bacterium]